MGVDQAGENRSQERCWKMSMTKDRLMPDLKIGDLTIKDDGSLGLSIIKNRKRIWFNNKGAAKLRKWIELKGGMRLLKWLDGGAR